MPRMSYVGSDSFRRGQQSDSPENENFDFCADCWPTVLSDPRAAMGVPPHIGDNWIDVDEVGEMHPEYDGEDYKCHRCGKVLTSDDDYGD